MGENAYSILVGKPTGKILFGRHRHSTEDNIKTGLKIIKYEGVKWVHLAQNRNQWQDLVYM
jgi:hypothetical protein